MTRTGDDVWLKVTLAHSGAEKALRVLFEPAAEQGLREVGGAVVATGRRCAGLQGNPCHLPGDTCTRFFDNTRAHRYNPGMADKDVLYHEVLEAFQAGGCALCRLGRRAADSYLHALIYEGVTDPGLRQQLRDARGPCHRHAWRMANRRGSVLGTAIMYRDFVNTLTKVLEAGEDAPRRSLFGGRGQSDLDAGLAPTAPCPACTLETDATHRTAKILLKHLDDAEMARTYVTAGGLCMPHFRLTLSHAGGGAARTLAQWQATAWRDLRDDWMS